MSQTLKILKKYCLWQFYLSGNIEGRVLIIFKSPCKLYIYPRRIQRFLIMSNFLDFSWDFFITQPESTDHLMLNFSLDYHF